MARFMGTVRLGARMRRVEVFGDPRHPLVQVDGVVVHDRKPFLARDTLVIDVMGQSVTLTWRYPGLTRLECDLTADGATTTLSPVTEAGEILMPLDATTKRRLHLRTLGYASVAGGYFFSRLFLAAFSPAGR